MVCATGHDVVLVSEPESRHLPTNNWQESLSVDTRIYSYLADSDSRMSQAVNIPVNKLLSKDYLLGPIAARLLQPTRSVGVLQTVSCKVTMLSDPLKIWLRVLHGGAPPSGCHYAS